MEYLESDTANVWRVDHARALRRFASKGNGSLEIFVIALTQTALLVFVVGDLLLVSSAACACS